MVSRLSCVAGVELNGLFFSSALQKLISLRPRAVNGVRKILWQAEAAVNTPIGIITMFLEGCIDRGASKGCSVRLQQP